MTDVETLLTETLQARTQDVGTPPVWVAPPTASPTRRPVLRWFVPVLASGAVVATVAVVITTLGTEPTPDPTPDPAPPAAPAELVGEVLAPPADMQWVSSLGVEILVPAAWSINNTGCGQSSAASVARGQLIALTCWTPEPVDKTIAAIGSAALGWIPAQDIDTGEPGWTQPPDPVMTYESTTVDGRSAQLGHADLADGRTAGVLRVPAADVAVVVRSTNPETVERVLASARLVEIDSAGCPTERPDALGFLADETTDPLGDLSTAVSASLCAYPTGSDARLAASTVVDAAHLGYIVPGLSELSFSATVDHESCSEPRLEPEETLLVALRLPDSQLRYVVVAEQGCDVVAIAATHDRPAALPHELHSALFGTLLHMTPG